MNTHYTIFVHVMQVYLKINTNYLPDLAFIIIYINIDNIHVLIGSATHLLAKVFIMLDQKPYIVRATIDWIIDSGCTPYITVNCINGEPTGLPIESIDDRGFSTIPLDAKACSDFKHNNEFVKTQFKTKGTIHSISVSLSSLVAVYAKETGKGYFTDGIFPKPTPLKNKEPNKPIIKQSGHLKLVK